MKTKVKDWHTPTPCRSDRHETPCDMFCEGCLTDCWEDNKPLIVRAVNAHEELVKIALHVSRPGTHIDSAKCLHCQAKKALAKAEVRS